MKRVGILFGLFCFINIIFAQQKQVLIKDTTDSNSIVNKVQTIKELEVRSKMAAANIKLGSGGLVIDVAELRKLPNIVGDADPFKALQYMGGISQAGDASANMNVRGGNNDQNLILLNGCNIQNPTHVLGLFSVFNPDLMDQMRFYKTGIPAEYGGRLSSVIDVKNFSNIPDKVHIDGGVGLISSRLALKVPLSDKFSLYASQRGSYIGAFVVPMLIKAGINEKLAQNDFEFSDTNVGFNYRITSRTKLSGHFYSGNDRISITENAKFALDNNKSEWGNRVAGIQLQHIFSERFSMVHALNSSEFYMRSGVSWLANNYSLRSNNSALSYKSDFVYQFNNHTIKSGIEASFNKTLPAFIRLSTVDSSSEIPTNINKSVEMAVYMRDEIEYDNLLVNVGLRAGLQQQIQNGEVNNVLSNNIPKYTGLEPRLFSRWLINEQSSVKASASRHIQYFSRVPVLNFGVPLEIFVPASTSIKPASVWHFSGGYFRNFNNNSYECSAELYFKSFRNLIEFGGNMNDLFAADKIMEVMYQGKGWAYGAEFMVRKNVGNLTGWINYTLGWNYRQFDQINDGIAFAATTDRRHDLTAVLMYKLNNKWSISATYSYATGSRLNLPRSWFVIDNKVVLEYSKYNAFSMPDYHRLDVSANYKLKPFWNVKSELNFSVYNVYNRANPFQVYFQTTNIANSMDFKIKMSYLLPILPSISWTFHL
jgi:hypothetical protein